MLTNRELTTLVFLFFVDLIVAYIIAKSKAGLTDSTGTMFKNTLINLFIIMLIELLIYGISIVFFNANPLNLILFGGDLISGLGSLIGALVSKLV